MSRHDFQEKQADNTSKLVMSTFYKVCSKDGGASAADIAKHLQDKFGEVFRLSILTGKAEETLRKSAAMGFLERHGERYLARVAREAGCCRRRRKRRRKCRRRRQSRRRRRRPCCC